MAMMQLAITSHISQPKHPWCKKSSGQELKSQNENQIGQPRPPAVDEIKIIDNDDKAAKHSGRKRTFCGLIIIIKKF